MHPGQIQLLSILLQHATEGIVTADLFVKMVGYQ